MAGRKQFVVAMWLTLSAVALCSSTESEEAQNVIEAECASQHNVEADLADKALSENENLSEDILCYARCTMKGMGILDENNIMNDDVLMSKFEVEDAPLQSVLIRGILNKCKEITTDEPQSCGYAYAIVQCMVVQAKELAEQAS